MQEEADFLNKMQGVYDAQNADAKRTLNSLLFEYEHTLAQFPALAQEVQKALNAVQDLDVTAIVERLRPALKRASEIAIEMEMLDDEVLANPEIIKFCALMKSRLTLATAQTFFEKFHALVGKLSGTAPSAPLAAEEPPSAPAAPAKTPDELEFDKALALYKGENGQAKDFVQAAVHFHRLADKNHPQALHYLFLMYLFGQGVAKDRTKAVQYMRKAVDVGDLNSMTTLSHWYRSNGNADVGIQKNFEQAKFFANRAAELGSSAAWSALGMLYLAQDYPERNPIRAMGYFQQGAEAKDSYAWHSLGQMYLSGTDIPKNTSKAIECFEKSFQYAQGDGGDYAAIDLADIYEFGRDVPQDSQRALQWLSKSSDITKKNICCKFGCGYQNSDPDKAIYWWTEGAQRGGADSMYWLAIFYNNTPRKNVDKSIEWCTKAIDAGFEYAIDYLINIYKYGERKNSERALFWLTKKAETNKPEALHELGDFYYKYLDDDVKAINWCNKAAEMGFAKSMHYLGDIYKKDGIYQDFAKAEYWYRRAIENGHASQFYLGLLYKQINDIDKAVGVFEQGADRGCSICYKLLIDIFVQKENFTKARQWLINWMKKEDLGGNDFKYLIPCFLEYEPLRDVVRAMQLCDRLLLSDAEGYEKDEACLTLGEFLCGEGASQNINMGIQYLEKAARQFAVGKFYYSQNAARRLRDIYRDGKCGIVINEAKAAEWDAQYQKLCNQ